MLETYPQSTRDSKRKVRQPHNLTEANQRSPPTQLQLQLGGAAAAAARESGNSSRAGTVLQERSNMNTTNNSRHTRGPEGIIKITYNRQDIGRAANAIHDAEQSEAYSVVT